MSGTLFWITGLSGAGKTTVGKMLYNYLKKKNPATVFLDGDILREVFGNDLGYSIEERHKSATRNAHLCHMLTFQGIDVVCCTISMFDDIRDWNRTNIENYREIYLKVSNEVLLQRNQKDLYTSSKSELVGFGVNMDEPKCPDMTIENDGKKSLDEILSKIVEVFKL